MSTFKEVATTFPINAPVEWIDSSSDTIQIGLVAGYSFNSVGELIVEVKPTTATATAPQWFLHPKNRIVQLTHAVTGDRLW